MISMNDSAVLLCGETRCWSLLGFEGLKLGKLRTTIFTCNGPIKVQIQSFHSVRKNEQDDDTQYYVGTIGT